VMPGLRCHGGMVAANPRHPTDEPLVQRRFREKWPVADPM
jgi:hypothetical protein